MNDPDTNWFQALDDAVRDGKRLIGGVAEINRVFDHIFELLSSAVAVYLAGSSPTATFLAITALEEIAKAHVGMFRRSSSELKRSKDALYSHAKKHELAAAPTVPMGDRLTETLGVERVDELINDARNGRFAELRERCIYFDRSGGILEVPDDRVDRTRAREVLLFCIEAFDDSLVGYTNHSLEQSGRIDELFSKAATS